LQSKSNDIKNKFDDRVQMVHETFHRSFDDIANIFGSY